MQHGLVNHVRNQEAGPSLPRVDEIVVGGAETGAAKLPLGRTQSARPAVVLEPAKEPQPAKSLTSETAGGLEDSGASEVAQSRPRLNSAGASSMQAPANAITNSSPSRESRERAEEVARKVVSDDVNQIRTTAKH